MLGRVLIDGTRRRQQTVAGTRSDVVFVILHCNIRECIAGAVAKWTGLSTIPFRIGVAVRISDSAKTAVVITVGHHDRKVLLTLTASCYGQCGTRIKKRVALATKVFAAIVQC